MQQLDIFSAPPVPEPAAVNPTDRVTGGGLDDKFRAFHEANPHVYRALRDAALRLKRKGWQQYSIMTLLGVLRYQADLETVDPDPRNSQFKMCNSYAPFYARLIMDNEPELAGFFEIRTQTWQKRL